MHPYVSPTHHAQEEWRGEVVHLSWSPRAFLLKGFLSDEECDHLIKLVGGGSRAGANAECDQL